ncbi:GntR family transcriptional regulator [Amycolatopsis sp. GM8]|uniref:GntR family transcriptional regulator n=1 Tax=Amycolatopsis sp. GM8 TaxID=2896530 RepID=UPI001F00D324|nr:GntR family transcriptional regulator [Amycolatopsis sp. GM8]
MTRPRSSVNRSEALHLQVARNIRNDIEAGVLRDGQRLPSTRELAQEWGVSTPVINDAMGILAKEGLIESKPRAGRVVRVPEQVHVRPRSATPHVVFVGGYAGSGKTELGRIISRETGWALLDKDTLTRPVVEAALESAGYSPYDRESDHYLATIRPREYEALINSMTENLQCGNGSVVTAPFIREFADSAWVSRVQATASDFGATTTFVWLYCDAETMHTYVRHRGAARDAAKIADWSGYLAGIDLDLRPPVPHVVVDNSASSSPLQEQARELIEQVRASEAE